MYIRKEKNQKWRLTWGTLNKQYRKRPKFYQLEAPFHIATPFYQLFQVLEIKRPSEYDPLQLKC